MMKYKEKSIENDMQVDMIKIKSTLRYIAEDLDLVMQRVTYPNYSKHIPNLYERLTEFKNDLLKIKQELSTLLQQIEEFEIKLNLAMGLDEINNSKINIDKHGELRHAMQQLKVKYKALKFRIIEFTKNL